MTTTKELFAIASYDSKFVDYYLDVQGNLWSVKTGKPKMIKNPSIRTQRLHGPYRKHDPRYPQDAALAELSGSDLNEGSEGRSECAGEKELLRHLP